MNWIWYMIVGVLAANVLFIGVLYLNYRRELKRDEQRKQSGRTDQGMDGGGTEQE